MGYFNQLAVAPDGRRLAAGIGDGTVYLLRLVLSGVDGPFNAGPPLSTSVSLLPGLNAQRCLGASAKSRQMVLGGFRRWLWTITRHKRLDLFRASLVPAVGGSRHHVALQQGIMQPISDEAEATSAGDRVALLLRALALTRRDSSCPRGYLSG